MLGSRTGWLLRLFADDVDEHCTPHALPPHKGKLYQHAGLTYNVKHADAIY